MAPPFVIVREATGDVPVPAPLVDAVCAVIGVASQHTTDDPALYGRQEVISDIFADGPGPRAAGHIIKTTRTPHVFVPVPPSVDGSYGTIDVSGITGTAKIVVDENSLPLNDYEPYIVFTKGGTFGTTGIKFRVGTDKDRGLSGVLNLGTNYSYTIPGTGVKFVFNPPANALVAIATEIRTDLLAHMADGVTVHDAADSVAAALITLGAPSTNDQAWAVLNECRAAYISHIANTSAHNSADITNVLVAPVATDQQSGITLALDIKAKLNAHEADDTVHNVADSSNLITSAAPSRGTVNANDVAWLVATGPKWIADDVADAFDRLAEHDAQFAMIYLAGPCDATEAATVSSGLDTLLGVGKRACAILQARGQNVGESETAWIDALVTDFSTFVDDRIGVCAGTAWVAVQEGSKSRKYNTTFAYALMARLVSINRFVSPGQVDLGAIPGVQIVDQQGKRIAHDENYIGGLDEGRFMALCRLPDPTRRDGAYLSHPYVMKGPDGRVSQFQVRRVANAMERDAASVSFGELGAPGVYDPSTQLISATAASDFAGKIFGVLTVNYEKDISNPKDPNLVEVDRSVTVDGDDMFLSVTVNAAPLKYVGGIKITFQLKV